LNRIQPKVKK